MDLRPDLGGDSPLVCTDDESLLHTMLDWCSAIGVSAEVARDVGMLRRSWRSARFVLVGSDLADQAVASDLPRRRATYLVTGPGESQPWNVALLLGATDVLSVADGQRALTALTQAFDGGSEAVVISVIGGTGGAGASCLAAGVALEGARRGRRVLLLDADRLGGGLDLLLGMEHVAGLRWPDLVRSDGPITARALADALPTAQGIAVLSWGRTSTTSEPSAVEVVAAATRGFDLVVCDVARHVDGLGRQVLERSLLSIVVVPASVRAVGAAQTVTREVVTSSSAAVVAAAARPGLSASAMEQVLELPVVARLRTDRRLPTAIDQGLGPGGSSALRRAAAPVLALVGIT